jgi:hypothetical protein
MRYIVAAALFGAVLSSAAAAAVPPRPGHVGPLVHASGTVDNDTYHYDTLRSGWNNAESVLNTSNVTPSQFGKLFSVKMDGITYGQPLIASSETIPNQGVHDLLIAGTNRDKLYAYDADTGAPIWETSFAKHGATDVPIDFISYCNNTGNSDGVLSTPVIDRSTDSLYVVAATVEGPKNQKAMHYRLHRLQLATGQDFAGSPVDITATYNWSGGSIAFNPQVQFQRGALLEWTPPSGSGDPQIEMTFGSQCDFYGNQYHGWAMSYDAYTLGQTAVQNVTPAQDAYGNYFGGIWMSGNGPAEDAGGSIYFSVGNGTFDGVTSFGESILKLPPTLATTGSGFQFFTPYTVYQDNSYDADTGSGGVMLLPDQPGTYPHEIVMQGKDGVFTLLNRDNMGGYVPGGPDNALAELGLGGVWASPAYYQDASGNAYVFTTGGPLYSVQISNGTANVVGATRIGFPSSNGNGSTPTISSYQSQPGTAIAWIVQRPSNPPSQPMYLYAFDASNLSKTLYSEKLGKWPFSDSNATLVPTVANGRVYVPNATSIVVYGLK